MEKVVAKSSEQPSGSSTHAAKGSEENSLAFDLAPSRADTWDRPNRLPSDKSLSHHPSAAFLHPVLRLQRSIGNRAVGQFLQRQCTQCAEEEDEKVQRKSGSSSTTKSPSSAAEIVPNNSCGEPLDDHTRDFMESRLDADFSRVRVHTDAPAAAAAEAIDATAFTTSQDIYFAPGKYAPDHSEGQRLLAHELAHTVQQSQGQGPTKIARKVAGAVIGHPDDPLEQQADVAADRVMTAGPQPAPPPPAAPDAIAEIAVPASGGAGAPAAPPPPSPNNQTAIQRDEAGDHPWWQESAAKAVAYLSPELAEIIRIGPFQYFKGKVEGLVKEWIPTLLGKFSISGAVEAIQAWFVKAFNTIKGALSGDPMACQSFADALAKLREVAENFIDSPAIEELKKAFQTVDHIYGQFVELVLAPQFDALKAVLGPVWRGIKSLSDRIAGWIRTVRNGWSSAWDWAAEKLGLSGDDGSGVWAWVTAKASQAWDSIKQTLGPISEPILSVVRVAKLLTPLGQINLIVEEGPKIVTAVKWLWEHRDDPDIAKHAREMKDTYLPQIIDAVQNFDSLLSSGFAWLAQTVGQLSTSVLTFLGGLFKVPLLDTVHSIFQDFQVKLQEFATWSQEKLRQGVEWVKQLGQRIANYVKPYKEVLSSIVVALLNPEMIPVILAGWAWRKLNRCIKKPLIEFILGIVIKALEKIPDLVIFGPLWVLLKRGVLGFLKQVASEKYETQELVSDKFAKIISGASTDFLLGFVKGFLKGIWDGIADPFKAIWTVLEGANAVMNFFSNLAADALGIRRPPAPPAAGEQTFEKESGGQVAAPAASGATAPAPQASAAAAGGVVATAAVPAPAASGAAAPAPQASTVTTGGAAATPTIPTPQASAPAAPARPAAPAAQHPPAGFTPGDLKELGAASQGFVAEAGPDVTIVTTNFWGAAQEYFKGSGGMTFDSLMKKLGEAWTSMLDTMQARGGELAKTFIKWFMGDSAEEDVGDGVGQVAGNIVFQVLLDLITAGVWLAAAPIAKTIAEFINWPMEVAGRAFKLIGKLGKYLIDGAKGLGTVIKDAASGALKMVGEAIGRLGEKLMSFIDRMLGRFGKFFEKEAGKIEEGAEKLLGRETETLGEKKLATAADRELESQAARDARVEATGNVENKALTPTDAEAQLEHIAENPHLLEGTPPARRAKIGGHEWVEQPNGNWCRHSDDEACFKLPADIKAKINQAISKKPKLSDKEWEEFLGPKPEHGTPPGDRWRFNKYKAEGGELDFGEWFSHSRGGRGGGPGHSAIQEALGGVRDAETEVPVGDRFADAYWPPGAKNNVKPVYHQIGGLNPVRGDPIARERAAIDDLRKTLGKDADIYFWDKTNPGGKPLVNPDLLPDWVKLGD